MGTACLITAELLEVYQKGWDICSQALAYMCLGYNVWNSITTLNCNSLHELYEDEENVTEVSPSIHKSNILVNYVHMSFI